MIYAVQYVFDLLSLHRALSWQSISGYGVGLATRRSRDQFPDAATKYWGGWPCSCGHTISVFH